MSLFTSYHPAIIAIQSLKDQHPSALELYLFYYDDKVRILSCDNSGEDDEDFQHVSIEGLKSKIQQLRSSNREVYWGDKDDIPIKRRKRKITQISIQDEINQNVLLISVPSLKDDLNDVFAIVFPESLSNFYLHSDRNSMKSEGKKVIGNLIRNQILWFLDFYKTQERQIRSIKKSYQQLSNETQQIQYQLELEQSKNSKYLEDYLGEIVENAENEHGTNIRFHKDLLSHIQSLKISINKIESLLKESINTAINLALDDSLVEITPQLINAHLTENIEDEKISHRLVQLNKTISLLDKYELAANQLKATGKRVNGKNIAAELDISGPAVTDAIKKNASKIMQAIEKYPTKWPLICEFIKPVREIKWQIQTKNA